VQTLALPGRQQNAIHNCTSNCAAAAAAGAAGINAYRIHVTSSVGLVSSHARITARSKASV